MRRVAAVVAAGALSVMAPVAPADAMELKEFDVTFVDRDSCDFPVRVHFDGKYATKTFERANGQFAYKEISISPGLRVRYTNLESDESIRHSIAGPMIVRVKRSGVVSVAAVGPWGWSENPITGEPGLWDTRGRIFMVYDKDGVLVKRTMTGRLIDICEALA